MSKLNKEDLQQRKNTISRCVGSKLNMLVVFDDDHYKAKEIKEQIEELELMSDIISLALAQLENQKKCCGNCADWQGEKRRGKYDHRE